MCPSCRSELRELAAYAKSGFGASGGLVQIRQAGRHFLAVAENLGIVFPHGMGALAGLVLYCLDIAYLHSSTTVLDQALALKLACHRRHAGALDAHHLSQELLSERQVGACQVVHP